MVQAAVLDGQVFDFLPPLNDGRFPTGEISKALRKVRSATQSATSVVGATPSRVYNHQMRRLAAVLCVFLVLAIGEVRTCQREEA